MSLINGDSLSFSLFLVAVIVDSKDTEPMQTNLKTEETIVTSACFLNNLSDFFSFLFWCGKPQITWFVFSFLFRFFLSLKITTKNVRDLMFRSLFFPFFLLFLILKSACYYDYLRDDWSAFFSFLFRCGKLQITGFVLSFSFKFFLSLKITTKDIKIFLSSFLSFFYLFI